MNIGYASAKDNHASQSVLFTKDFALKIDGSVNEITWEKISQLSSLISTGLYVELVMSNPQNTSTSSTHRISGVTLVRNRYAPTEVLLASRSLIDELRYCQRYYEKSYAINTPPASITDITNASIVRSASTYAVTMSHPYKSAKRVNPSILMYSVATGAVGYGRNATSSADVATSVSGFSGSDQISLETNTSYGLGVLIAFAWVSSAEL